MAKPSPFKSVTSVLAEVESGDLIEFRRTGYSHWAVYVGGEFAIHMVLHKHKDKTATIRKDLVKKIAGKNLCRVNNLQDKATGKGVCARTPSDIVSTAESKVGDDIEYRLLGNNCEYFATLCRYGVPISGQVDTADDVSKCVTIVAGIVAALAYVFRRFIHFQRPN